MPIGRAKWFNDAKGFGFIEHEGAEDVFVHYTGIAGEGYRSLAEGAEVEFEVVPHDRGPRAENVRVIAEPADTEKWSRLTASQRLRSELAEGLSFSPLRNGEGPGVRRRCRRSPRPSACVAALWGQYPDPRRFSILTGESSFGYTHCVCWPRRGVAQFG